MKWESFETRAPGKWVLTGEHAVLRGVSAIALPHPEFSLRLRFEPEAGLSLCVTPESASSVISDILSGIRDGEEAAGRSFRLPEGRLEIVSSIPIGAGLGSSAALCVAISRWLARVLDIRDSKGVFEFATKLEHRFHGRSSGMDVAVINADEAISFSLTGVSPLGIKNLPRFTFHDTELRARTSDCVLQVGKLRESDPAKAMRLDEAMGTASRLAMEGLIRFDNTTDLARGAEGLALVARAMREAQECYYSWDLVPAEARDMEKKLLSEGALAVKMTGAGGGGMLVALWPSE
jgi:mevalonate kinase